MYANMILDVNMWPGHRGRTAPNDRRALCPETPFRLLHSSRVSLPSPLPALLTISRRLIFFSCAPSSVNAEFRIKNVYSLP